MDKHFTKDMKLKAIKYYNKTNNYDKTCKKFGCSNYRLERWVNRYKQYKDRKKSEKLFFNIITKDNFYEKNVSDDFDYIIKKYFLDISRVLFLDFHGVSDLYDLSEKIPSSIPICIISYIGGNPKTIQDTTNVIKERIKNNEILLGFIVYNKSNYPTIGTKGWLISKIMNYNKDMHLYFIDDGIKNIQCVKNLNNNNITTFFINKKNNPKVELLDYLNKIAFFFEKTRVADALLFSSKKLALLRQASLL